MVPEVRRRRRPAGREAPRRRVHLFRLGRRLHRIQIRVGLPAAALAAAELAALAAAADVIGAAGCRGDTSAAATFSSTRTLILCVVSLRVRASDSFCIAGELEA